MLASTTAARAFDMSPLCVGTMLRTPQGSRTTVPFLPDMTTDGWAWVVESTPTRLRIRERAIVWNHVRATFDQTFELVAPGQVDFRVASTTFGVPMPALHKRYELVDAGRGWLRLRSAGKPGEAVGEFRVDGASLHVDLPGPLGTHDTKVEGIVQPGAAGYVQPPAGWLPPGA